MNNKTKTKLLKTLVVFGSIFFVIIAFGTWLYFKSFEAKNFQFGVHFSKSYAEYLGLDWKKTYLSILDELKVKKVRLAVPWNEIEDEKDHFYFDNIDWQISEAAKRNVEIILVIGRRTPHWPECHDPKWVKEFSAEYVVDKQLKMVENVVNRYKNNQAIKIWQVENEPLLNVFGECPKSDVNLLRKEVSLVKTLDSSRPILVTDSGELSTWKDAAKIGDMFGSTMYRVTYNKWFGYAFYHMPPIFYTSRMWLNGKTGGETLIAELQAEPWSPKGLLNSSLEEQFKSMDANRLRIHAQYARETGMGSAYFWGAEWWYWLKEKKGDSSLWLEAQKLFKE